MHAHSFKAALIAFLVTSFLNKKKRDRGSSCEWGGIQLVRFFFKDTNTFIQQWHWINQKQQYFYIVLHCYNQKYLRKNVIVAKKLRILTKT